jgi:hypothetical protein
MIQMILKLAKEGRERIAFSSCALAKDKEVTTFAAR